MSGENRRTKKELARDVRARRTDAERVGYHRGWLKRMTAPMRVARVRLELEQRALLERAEAIRIAMLTIDRMLSIELRDVKGR
jgi:RecA-family ATPase